MTPGEILDSSLQLCRTLGWTFLRVTAGPSLFCLAAMAFIFEITLPSLGTTHAGNNMNAQIGEAATTLLVALFVAGPLFLIGLSYSTAIVVKLVSDTIVDGSADVGVAIQSARQKLFQLFKLGFRELLLSLSAVAVAVGLLFLGGWISNTFPDSVVLSGILVAVGATGLLGGGAVFLYIVGRHALAPAVLLVEGVSAKEAGKRSASLLEKRDFQSSGASSIFNLYALIVVAALIEYGGWASLFGLLGVPEHLDTLLASSPLKGFLSVAVDLLPDFVVIWTLVPLWAATFTLLYYERRIRLEGYDIEALAKDIQIARTGRFNL